jgi:hypothetical protein
MRGRFGIAVAIVVCLAFVFATLSFGASTIATAKLTLSFKSTGTPPYNQSTFSGKLKITGTYSNSSPKAKASPTKTCKKGRKVVVKGVGSGKTNKKGKYAFTVSDPKPGTYQAKVKKKVKTVQGTKIVCKKAKSNKVTVS